MTIESVDMGARSSPVEDAPEWWGVDGISAAAVSQNYEFGLGEQIINIHFTLKSETLKNNLKDALADKQGQTISVTPDSGDDLQIGASGATDVIYVRNSFRASHIPGTVLWDIDLQVKAILEVAP